MGNRTRLAVFASGSGTNAERLALYFKDHPAIAVSLIGCNKAEAYVLTRASRLGIPSFVFSGRELKEGRSVLERLQALGIDYLVLAGFLLLVPDYLLQAFPDKVINIHPALLPNYGGKGMYGLRVHEAVIAAGETESGITIHRVNGNYDEGAILFQARCRVQPGDTADILAARIHLLEHAYYPEVIERLVLGGEIDPGQSK